MLMGKPLMLQEADADRIETLKKRLGARTNIQVVRSALEPPPKLVRLSA